MENEIGKQEKKRPCDHCGTEYVFDKKTSKYCSNVCRSGASKKARLSGFVNPTPHEVKPEKPMQTIPMFAQANNQYAAMISPPAQMMIDHYKSEVGRWEKKYDAEVAEHKITKQTIDQLKQDLRDNEKPGGLNGFLGTDAGVEIVRNFAPLLAEFGRARMMPNQIGGVDPEMKELAEFIIKWVGAMPAPLKEEFVNMIGILSKTDNETALYKIKSITTQQQWQQQ